MENKCLIVGITGVVGSPLSELLLGQGWTVYGISRSEKPYVNEKVNMINCDLLNTEDARENLSQIINEVSYLFFCAWVPGKTPEEEIDLNTRLFENTLAVFDKSSSLKHVYLQTGTKHYGVHLGPERGYKTPAREDDPRLDAPIFYYAQEDLLFEYSKLNNWSWNIARPDAIIGFTLGTKMNLLTTICMYAALLKEEGKPLIFPYPNTINRQTQFCDSDLLSRAIFWMCTEGSTKNQAFNVDNGDYPIWSDIWSHIAKFFGMKVEVSDEQMDLKKFFEEREETWNNMKKKYQLQDHSLNDMITPEFMQFYTSINYDMNTSLEKIRSYGFVEQVSSQYMFEEYFESLCKDKIIPQFRERTGKESKLESESPAYSEQTMDIKNQ